MTDRASRKQSFKELIKALQKSDHWLILRSDKQGTHLHMSTPDDLALMAYFFHQDNELFEMVKEFKEAFDEEYQ